MDDGMDYMSLSSDVDDEFIDAYILGSSQSPEMFAERSNSNYAIPEQLQELTTMDTQNLVVDLPTSEPVNGELEDGSNADVVSSTFPSIPGTSSTATTASSSSITAAASASSSSQPRRSGKLAQGGGSVQRSTPIGSSSPVNSPPSRRRRNPCRATRRPCPVDHPPSSSSDESIPSNISTSGAGGSRGAGGSALGGSSRGGGALPPPPKRATRYMRLRSSAAAAAAVTATPPPPRLPPHQTSSSSDEALVEGAADEIDGTWSSEWSDSDGDHPWMPRRRAAARNQQPEEEEEEEENAEVLPLQPLPIYQELEVMDVEDEDEEYYVDEEGEIEQGAMIFDDDRVFIQDLGLANLVEIDPFAADDPADADIAQNLQQQVEEEDEFDEYDNPNFVEEELQHREANPPALVHEILSNDEDGDQGDLVNLNASVEELQTSIRKFERCEANHVAKLVAKAETALEPDESADMCIICFSNYSNTGDHRVVNLKCGHLYGRSCINEWIKNNPSCPTCKQHSRLSHIRLVITNNLMPCDTSEILELRQQLSDKNQIISELKSTILKKSTAEFIPPYITPFDINLTPFNGEYVKKYTLDLQNCSHSRRILFDPVDSMVLVTGSQNNVLFNSFGVYKITLNQMTCVGYTLLHSDKINDVCIKNKRIVSVSTNGEIKLTNSSTGVAYMQFKDQGSAWSCCWNNDNDNIFYTGHTQGIIKEFDIRNTRSCVATNTAVNKSPITALQMLPDNRILGTHMNGVVIYQRGVDEPSFNSTLINLATKPLSSVVTSSVCPYTPNSTVFASTTVRLTSDTCHEIYSLAANNTNSIVGNISMGRRQTRRLQTVIAKKPGTTTTNINDYFLMAADENRNSVKLFDLSCSSQNPLLQELTGYNDAVIAIEPFRYNNRHGILSSTLNRLNVHTFKEKST